MIYSLLTSMPMFVCLCTTAALGLNLYRTRNVARAWLLAWSAACTMLYACHYIFFQHINHLLPLTDSLYVLCNLSVYPLYLIYIHRLTHERLDRRLLIPLPVAVAGGAIYAVLYAMMSPPETQQFIDGYLYHQSFDADTPLVAAQIAAHTLCKAVFTFEVIGVLFLGRRYIRHYNRLVEELMPTQRTNTCTTSTSCCNCSSSPPCSRSSSTSSGDTPSTAQTGLHYPP